MGLDYIYIYILDRTCILGLTIAKTIRQFTKRDIRILESPKWGMSQNRLGINYLEHNVLIYSYLLFCASIYLYLKPLAFIALYPALHASTVLCLLFYYWHIIKYDSLM